MKIGLGIDTGGTYTDGVLYDFEEEQVLASAKSLTTKENLSIGIINVLNKLPKKLFEFIETVSLSTTLATNACVEGIAAHAKLIFIGADESVVEKTGTGYGLDNLGDIYYLDGEINLKGEIIETPDWDKFKSDLKEFAHLYESFAVVQNFGIKNPVFEKQVKSIIEDTYNKQVICGHELFHDLNYIKRGSSTVLNAKLIPIIKNFLDSIKLSLKEYNINAPVVIVRSDGSLMSQEFTGNRPVETLLCGPASSVMGGMSLTKEKNCLVIDMGGTTTDIAIVKDGTALKTQDGVNVGNWKTFVKSVYIDTFGLGGDSHVTVDAHTGLTLKHSRVIPLCILVNEYPHILEELKCIADSKKTSSVILCEYFIKVKDISGDSYYNDNEKEICDVLSVSPLSISTLAEKTNNSIYALPIKRLEAHGIIMRSGLTPTDIMHIKGDFDKFSKDGAVFGATHFLNLLETSMDKLCKKVYDLVKEKLYTNVVRILLENEYKNFKKNGIGSNLEFLIKESYEYGNFINTSFSSSMSLVGIGAPIHVFLPDVAKKLGVKCIIPHNSDVANAVGAVVGNILVTHTIEIEPQYGPAGISGYIIFDDENNHDVKEYTQAINLAEHIAKKAAYKEAINRGAIGEINVSVENEKTEGTYKSLSSNKSIHLKTSVTATAIANSR